MRKTTTSKGASVPTPSDLSDRTIVICDDHPVIRHAVRDVCRKLGCTIVGETGLGAEALDLVTAYDPDLLVLDQNLPDMDGPTVHHHIRTRGTHTKILTYTSFTSSGRFFEWIRQPDGPHGAVGKDASVYELRTAIVQLLTSDVPYIPASLRHREIDSRDRFQHLSAGELVILTELTNALSLLDIARNHNLQPQTVRSYMSRIYTKLDLPTKTLHAAAVAYKQWLVAGYMPPSVDSVVWEA